MVENRLGDDGSVVQMIIRQHGQHIDVRLTVDSQLAQGRRKTLRYLRHLSSPHNYTCNAIKHCQHSVRSQQKIDNFFI